VAFIGELKLTVNPSGEGVISGHVASSEGDTALAFAPVTGSYSVAPDCTGTATITPKGQSPLNFSFVVVDCGKEMLAIETDADTVVSGTLQRIALPCCNYEQLSEVVKQAVEAGDALRKNHTLLRRALGLADQKAIEEAIPRDAASRVAGILRASRLANCRQLKL
jgi:hypothetical protein